MLTIPFKITDFLLGWLLLVPWCLLLVGENQMYPYVGQKAYAFRAVIDFGLLLWVVSVVRGELTLARLKSPVLGIFLGLLVWMLIANMFGIDPSRSFWSTFERSDGWLQWLHYGVWLLMLVTVVDSRQKWLAQALNFVLVAVVLAGLSYIEPERGDRVVGRLGNPIYLGNMMVFALFFLAFVVTAPGRWSRVQRVGLAVVLAMPLLWSLSGAASRGALVGLAAGIGFAAWLVFMFRLPGIRMRVVVMLSAVVLLGAAVSVVVEHRDTLASLPLVENTLWLKRLAEISLDDQTTIDRFENWRVAISAIGERPLTGWGQENYSTAFLEHYRQGALDEAIIWFDRSHNNYLDWAAGSGLVGLLIYLGLIAYTLFVLWRHSGWHLAGKITLSGLIVAYLVKNIVAFDVISSSLAILLCIAIAAFREQGKQPSDVKVPVPIPVPAQVSITLLAVLAVGLAFNAAVRKPFLSNQAISASKPLAAIALKENLPDCRGGTGHPYLARYCAQWKASGYQRMAIFDPVLHVARLSHDIGPQFDEEQFMYLSRQWRDNTGTKWRHFQQKSLPFLTELMDSRLEDNPRDWKIRYRMALQLSSIKEHDQAIELMQEILEHTPNRTVFWVSLSKIYLLANRPEAALKAYRKAEALNPDYSGLKPLHRNLSLFFQMDK